ncbi:hypothetical protein CPB85DRAFT_1327236 [Mucidula mucida]|nr:hypothetical protein CPB85DRAFT_1327236 [Mucidula mucida]
MYLRPDGKKSVLAAIWQHLTARSGHPPLLVYADTSTEVNAVHNAGGRFTLVPPLDPLRRRHLLIFETFRELDGLFVSLLTLLVVLVLSMDRRDNEQPPKSSLPVSLQPLLLSSTTRNSSTRTTIVPEAADDDEQEQDRPPSPLSLPLSTRSAMTSPLYQLDRRRASQPYEGYDPLPPQSLLPELDPGVRHRIPGTSSIHHGSMRPDYHPRAAPNPNYLPPQGEPHYAPQWREGETSTPSWPYPADPPRSSLQQQHPGYLGHAGPSRSYDNLYEQIPPVMSHSREPIDRRSYLPPAPMPSTSQQPTYNVRYPPHVGPGIPERLGGSYGHIRDEQPMYTRRDEYPRREGQIMYTRRDDQTAYRREEQAMFPRLPALTPPPNPPPPASWSAREQQPERWYEERLTSPEEDDRDGEYKPAGSSRAKGKKRAADPQDPKTAKPPKTARIQKVTIACDFCRNRKLRCDANRPKCYNCIARNPGNECVYAAEPKRRGKGKQKKKKAGEGSSTTPQDTRASSSQRGASTSLTRSDVDLRRAEPYPSTTPSEPTPSPQSDRQPTSSRYLDDNETDITVTPRGRASRRSGRQQSPSPREKSPKKEQ